MSRNNLAEKLLETKPKAYLKVEKTITDIATGEIVGEQSINVHEPTFRFKVGNGLGKQSRYTKSFHTVDLKFSKATYYKYFHYMERRLEKGTNRVVTHTDVLSKNIPIRDVDLAKISDANIRTIRNFINECIEKNYIAKLDKNNEFFGYIVNPIYSMNGSNMNIFLYVLFSSDEFDKHISQVDLKRIKTYLSERDL